MSLSRIGAALAAALSGALLGSPGLPSAHAQGTALAGPAVPASAFEAAAVEAAVSPCPREALASMLRSAVAPGDVGAALALERETLRLCATRQALALEVLGLEGQLRRLLPVALPAPAEPEPQPSLPEPDPGPEPMAVLPPPKPSYGWFTIYGQAGDLTVGVTDGRSVFYAREGEALPGGAVVEGIEASPPAVHVSGAASSPLPWRRKPGR